MKHVLVLLLLFTCMIVPAQAEETPEAAVLALVEARYPGCTIGKTDQWGDTAAAALEHEGKKILCIMEKQSGQWVMTVNSSTILLPEEGMPSSFLLDTDETLFWTYTGLNDTSFHFHASRSQDGRWYFNDETMIQFVETSENSDGIKETMLTWSEALGGCLVLTERLSDMNENLIDQQEPLYLPAAWLKGQTDLRLFDISQLPYLMETEYEGQWPDLNYRKAAAAQLMPGYTYQGGSMSGNTLQLLMDRPDGKRVLSVLDLTDGATLVESAPLPRDTYYGVENFTTSLGLNGYCVTIDGDGTYGVTYLDGYIKDAADLRFGPMVICSDGYNDELLYFGMHPWSNIRTIDWNTLPTSLASAVKSLDTSDCALVDNPDPKDRLHLREEPRRDSKSLGKYYSGSPVLIHQIKGDWAEVIAIGEGWGQTGWMMKKYLDFSDSLVIDPEIMPDWYFRAGAMLYAAPDREAYHRPAASDTEWQVVGIIGDEWRHVWNPWTGEAGFARVEDEMPGNG